MILLKVFNILVSCPDAGLVFPVVILKPIIIIANESKNNDKNKPNVLQTSNLYASDVIVEKLNIRLLYLVGLAKECKIKICVAK